MKAHLASPRHLFLGMVALAAAVILSVQWHVLSTLRQENRQRLDQQQERQRLSRENQSLEASRLSNQELEQLRRATQDLHKLRNEVSQLRKQRPALARAKAENERLRRAKEMREQMARLPEQPGFVPKESWADAGWSTPEATARTFFWMLREGKFDRVLDCLSPEARQTLGKDLTGGSEHAREETREMMHQLKGYRVAQKKVISAEEIVLGIQAPIFGDGIFQMSMKQLGNGWRINGMNAHPD